MPSATTAQSSRAKPKHPEGCLFCRRHDGGFTSREHIFSQALGNDEYVLDPGVVCDRCNHGPLARSDDALTNFPAITLLRAERGLPTKEGKAVVSKWGNATIAFSAPGTLEVYGASKKALTRMPPEGGKMPHGGGKMALTTGGPITADRIRNIVRSVWKSALELMYWDHGEVAFAAIFDSARLAIVRPERASGWAVLPKNGKPHGHVALQYQPRIIAGHSALPVHMDVFGVEIFTDLLRRGISREDIDPPWPANIWTF